MNDQCPAAAFAAVRAADPDAMSRDELGEHLQRLRAVRAWVDAAEIRATRRSRQLAADGKAGSAEAANVRAGQRSSREARAVSDRADVCDSMPQFESLLNDGAVSAGHVDAVARAANKLDDVGRERLASSAADYADQATRSSVDAFERAMAAEARRIAAATASDAAETELESQRKRSEVKRWTDKVTGMCHTHLELDPLRDAEVWAAIDAQLAADRAADGNANTPWSELRVQAAVNAIKNCGGTAGTSGPARPEVGVLVSYEVLAGAAASSDHDVVCETVGGRPLPASTVRRLCCEASVFPVVLGGNGEALDVGRTRRTATRAQRHALAAMHRTCGHPDCTVSIDACRAHHVRFWTKHLGPTDLSNLLPLCERHHHLVHEGGWSVSMTPDRVTTWTRPDGSVYLSETTTDRIEQVVAPASY